MSSYKWIKKDDEITGIVYNLDGYGFGDDLLVRIFKERKRNNITMKMENRYFPQIDNEPKEEQILVGSENGYKYLKEAKNELIKAFEQYQNKGIDSFVCS